jgi:hypothetical protein
MITPAVVGSLDGVGLVVGLVFEGVGVAEGPLESPFDTLPANIATEGAVF